MNDKGKYDDIIDLPHHQSDRRPHMPVTERAAQFSPFAALTGYEAAITEAGRLTETFRELDEDEKEKLDETLRLLQENREGRPEVTILYFEPDLLKEGGTYLEVTGRFLKVDQNKKVLIVKEEELGERQIAVSRIADIQMR